MGTDPARSRDESSHVRAKATFLERSRTGEPDGSSSLLLCPHHSFGSPSKRRRCALPCKKSKCTTHLRNALIRNREISAAQFAVAAHSQVAVAQQTTSQ